MKGNEDFKQKVYDLVAQIPEGKVTNYGRIATACGRPRAARTVGQIAHWGPEELPWHRVVKKDGSLAHGYTWGGLDGQKQALEAEGIEVNGDYRVNIEQLLWQPPDNLRHKPEE